MFGLFHGLILLPVILSIFGSDRIVKRHQRRRTTKEDLAAAAAPAAGMARAAAGMANPAYVVEEVSWQKKGGSENEGRPKSIE